ncbi:serine protease snake-like [Anopheles coustani]|uniref:serine protease snake-like n=1 Tax=Anopheles coustani TaxID=139045 RepID=UPI00265808C5|nr:serine protease snake-like [Anopheles coustani]
MWKGLIVLLSFSGFEIIADGERIAEEKCKEYQQLTALRSYILPLPMHAPPIDVTSHRCKNVVELIAGGKPAQNGEFPHHALLGYSKNGAKYEYKCGGTLISDQHVLTAAHCFATEYPSVVRLGVYDILKDAGHEVAIEGFLRHPDHRYTKVYHDIALVKLEQRVFLDANIRPACLWDSEIRNTSKYIATGFGKNETQGERTTQMMKVVLEEFPVQDCYSRYRFSSRFGLGITDGQLCVGSNTRGRDTCIGDSGGPLQTVTNPTTCTFHVVGVTSTGLGGCGVGKARAVYVKVSHYIGWIEDNIVCCLNCE